MLPFLEVLLTVFHVGAVAEVASVAKADAVVETTASEVVNAEAEQTPEPVEAATAIVEAVAADAEEPTAPVVEDATAEAAEPIAETTGEASSAEEAARVPSSLDM